METFAVVPEKMATSIDSICDARMKYEQGQLMINQHEMLNERYASDISLALVPSPPVILAMYSWTAGNSMRHTDIKPIGNSEASSVKSLSKLPTANESSAVCPYL
jgi:hypothetical protein